MKKPAIAASPFSTVKFLPLRQARLGRLKGHETPFSRLNTVIAIINSHNCGYWHWVLRKPAQPTIKEEEGSQDYWLLEESGEGKSLSFVYPLLNRAGSDGLFKPVSHRWLWLTLMDHKTKWIHMSMREDLWGGGWGVGEEGSENGQNASQTWLFLKERSG